MKKRILAALMCFAMVMSLLSSCGDKANSSSTGDSSQTVSESSSGGEETSDRVTEITLPISDQKLTFSEWRSWSNDYMSNYGEVKGIQLMEEKTNVHIDYTCVPATAAKEKFGLLLASGEYTDMIFGDSTIAYPGGMDAAVSDGAFWDMTDAVYQYMPNYFKLLCDRNDVREIAITDEGRNVGIYMIRCSMTKDEVIVETEPAWTGMAIRQDWLDDLNLSVPTTIDELHDVLVAFRDNYNAWMYLYQNGIFGQDYILSAYGVTHEFYLVDGGTEVAYGPMTDAYKSYLELMRDWYAEGLVDPDFTSTESTAILTANTYYANNQCGVGMSYQGTCGTMLKDGGYIDDDDFYLTPMVAPVLNKGDKVVTTFQSNIACNPTYVTASVSEEELPYLAQWLDWHYTYDYSVIASWGIEGDSYTVDENDPWYWVISDNVIHPETDGMTPMACFGLYRAFNNVGFMNWKNGLQVKEKTGAGYSLQAYETWAAQTDDIMIPLDASFTTEEANEYTSLYADIETYVAENTVKFINGTLDIDQNWDNFVSTIEKMNVQTCIDLKQASVDRYYGKVWKLADKAE